MNRSTNNLATHCKEVILVKCSVTTVWWLALLCNLMNAVLQKIHAVGVDKCNKKVLSACISNELKQDTSRYGEWTDWVTTLLHITSMFLPECQHHTMFQFFCFFLYLHIKYSWQQAVKTVSGVRKALSASSMPNLRYPWASHPMSLWFKPGTHERGWSLSAKR